MPDLPDLPGVPEVPDVPGVPDAPGVPDVPDREDCDIGAASLPIARLHAAPPPVAATPAENKSLLP
ncbi:hypothetical protein GCM10010246_59520 [Streptomyces cuspidosporus]|uniref:Uncharacterized protein n=1 Tax=Streptomyces cuspidosporus TaxID=66882 RepID=A0ABP5TT41_9ACTN